MEKYEKAKMEVIEFEAEDVITTSSNCSVRGPLYDEIEVCTTLVCDNPR